MSALIKDAERIQSLIANGYAGVMPDGKIVDRRENPSAIPIQANTLLGAPEPAAILGRKGGQAKTVKQQSARADNLNKARKVRWPKKSTDEK